MTFEQITNNLILTVRHVLNIHHQTLVSPRFVSFSSCMSQVSLEILYKKMFKTKNVYSNIIQADVLVIKIITVSHLQ